MFLNMMDQLELMTLNAEMESNVAMPSMAGLPRIPRAKPTQQRAKQLEQGAKAIQRMGITPGVAKNAASPKTAKPKKLTLKDYKSYRRGDGSYVGIPANMPGLGTVSAPKMTNFKDTTERRG